MRRSDIDVLSRRAAAGSRPRISARGLSSPGPLFVSYRWREDPRTLAVDRVNMLIRTYIAALIVVEMACEEEQWAGGS